MDEYERMEIQARLQQARRSIELYDFAPVACLTLDVHGVIEELNLAAATLLGVTRHQATGTPFLCYVCPEERTKFLDHLLQCRTAQDRITELDIMARPGRRLPVQLHSRLFMDGDKRHYPSGLTDLTALRRAEAERLRLLTATQHAQSASLAKDRFLAMLSHELRTPLTPILAAVSSPQLFDGLPESVRPVIEMIRRNIQIEARLIDDLLDVTRIANNKLELRRENSDLHEIIRCSAAQCAEELTARGQTLTLQLEATATFADADATRMEQVLWNLLNNAMKFTPPGGRITIRTANTGSGKITISVSDTGRGIEPTLLQRLFEPFEQLGVRPEGIGGLGLGLSIARKLVEAHGGRIAAFSAGAGKGATFEITLPTVAAPARPATAASHDQPPNGHSLKILLVDDHDDTIRVMSRLLRKVGHEVRVAQSVKEAIDMTAEPFDMLVSDLGLPDGSGLEIMRAISATRQHVPGIALSGFATPDDIQHSKDAGFDEHMAKPVDFTMLLSTIDHLSKKTAAPPA